MNIESDRVLEVLEALPVLDDGVPGHALDLGAVVVGAELELDLAHGRVGAVASAGVNVLGDFWEERKRKLVRSTGSQGKKGWEGDFGGGKSMHTNAFSADSMVI